MCPGRVVLRSAGMAWLPALVGCLLGTDCLLGLPSPRAPPAMPAPPSPIPLRRCGALQRSAATTAARPEPQMRRAGLIPEMWRRSIPWATCRWAYELGQVGVWVGRQMGVGLGWRMGGWEWVGAWMSHSFFC